MSWVLTYGSGRKNAPLPKPWSYPVALNAGKSYFLDQNGNPCFACGEDAFDLAVQLGASDVQTYLADRASRGINLIWVGAVDNIYSSSPPNDNGGNAPFSGSDFTNFNSAYWTFVDFVMQQALLNGITVLLNPCFVGLSSTAGYYTSFKAASTATIQTYGTFLANRYKGFPNLIWLLGGDADPNDAESYANLNSLGAAIKAVDPSHLMTLEASRFTEAGPAAPNGGYSSVEALTLALGSVPSWLDFNWVYLPPANIPAQVQACYSEGYPCLLGEDWYELEHSTTALQLRTEAYGAVLGGATLGRMFGNGQIWPFNSPNSGNGTTPTWQSQLSSTGSVGQQLLGKLFRSRRFQLLVPDVSNVVMTTGSAGGSICARTSDGQTIIAYLPTNQTVTIDMTKITDGGNLANCNWYNPSTGAVTSIGNLANSGTHNFTSPDSNDWVLVIDSAAANLRTPGT